MRRRRASWNAPPQCTPQDWREMRTSACGMSKITPPAGTSRVASTPCSPPADSHGRQVSPACRCWAAGAGHTLGASALGCRAAAEEAGRGAARQRSRQRAGEEQRRDREGQEEGAEQNRGAAEGRGWVSADRAVVGPRLTPPPSPDAPTRALHIETATATAIRFSTGCLAVALTAVGAEVGEQTHAGGAPAGRRVEYPTVRVLRPPDACPLPMLSPS